METAMTDKRTGGPAFPVHPELVERLGCENSLSDVGMTLRDYFAAKAMQSYLADRAWQAEIPHSETARVAYIVADAMLEARNGVAVGRKIEELGLLVKTENCLKADGICTVEQLTKLTSNHLLKIPNMGRKSVGEIEQALFMQGLRLRDGQP
jgi:DNA-directed RNA polymerase alpha subunit